MQHLLMEALQLRLAQLRTQDLIVELLWKRRQQVSTNQTVRACSCDGVGLEVLTHGEAELQHMHGSFLLQEVHETKEEVLLLPDLPQLQLQHLDGGRETDRCEGQTAWRRGAFSCGSTHRRLLVADFCVFL